MANFLQTGENRPELVATSLARPGSFPLGSLESRAAARALALVKGQVQAVTSDLELAIGARWLGSSVTPALATITGEKAAQ